MTVEQFRQLPETGPFYYELRHGEPVRVTRPKYRHVFIQSQLQILLWPIVQGQGRVMVEFPFRPLPEHELWVADVAYISNERLQKIDPGDNLAGAPELVIEVLSPSNTAAEINDKEKLCLENGARQFWVVDPDLRQVKVSTPDGITTTFRSSQSIPLQALGGGSIKVDDIFA
jgi:Uma2 family endonuclease